MKIYKAYKAIGLAWEKEKMNDRTFRKCVKAINKEGKLKYLKEKDIEQKK